MIISSKIVTRSASSKDLPRLANLIHFEAYVHRHLDYRPALDWVGHEPFLVIEAEGKIVAALACPPDPPPVAWIRLFAVSAPTSPAQAWATLWSETIEKLSGNGKIQFVAGIPLYSWFESILKKSGFQQTHSIVMLNRDTTSLPEEKPSKSVAIRPMTLDDLEAVQSIDEESFSPVWVNSLNYLEIAFRQAAVATVADLGDKLAGYQISTPTAIGGHLARLAVKPGLQGRGVGYALLYDLIHQFMRRGARTITVNTQTDNFASLSLYRRTAFQPTGEEYPIYQLGI